VLTGKAKKEKGPIPTYTETFGNALVRIAQQDAKVVGITAAMGSGTGIDKLARELPERTYDVGIAEQHAVTFAAGMATEGFRPVVAIYSTFLQRGYDQILHDVCLQNLHVVFALDRGGLVGADGPTHHGVFDFAYLRPLPNMVIMAPKDENELQHMLATAVDHTGPIAVRYPRGEGWGVALDSEPKLLPIGKAELLHPGTDIVIAAIGHTVLPALRAAQDLAPLGISAAVVNARFVKPLDKELLSSLLAAAPRLLTVEDHVISAGFGSAVLEFLADEGIAGIEIRRLGVPDRFVPHGTQDELRKLCGFDKDAIAQAALQMVRRGKKRSREGWERGSA
jgi:1-deoxy-D-xylulose-5-phosphate synthase